MAVDINKKYPHINFIKTLLLGRCNLQEIYETLEKHGFSKPSTNELGAIRRDLETTYPEPTYLNTMTKTESSIDIDWLVENGFAPLYGFWFKIEVPNTHGIQGAFNLVDDPLMFRLVTSLAITGITDEDIELLVNGKYNQQYASEDISLFLHYFFNMKNWSRVNKAAWIKKNAPAEYARYYKIALKGDKDYLIWKLGAAPDKSFEQMLSEMSTDAYYNFKERSRNDPELAQKWGTLAVKLIEKLDKVKKDEQKSNDFFDMIEFSVDEKADQDGIIHMEDLDEIARIAEKQNPNNEKTLE